uniref:Uncharacterized protein n=1 Tax=Anguilla anguilla TaxID=7936 RepID=A0A0E9W8W1_ANGAN
MYPYIHKGSAIKYNVQFCMRRSLHETLMQ